MAIRDWPPGEQPREKLLRQGAGSLSDAELLAIFLRTGVPGTDVVTLARQLLTQFDSLQGLLGASQHDFCQARGMGVAKFVQLQASLEISRRYLAGKLRRGDAIHSVQDTRNYLKLQLQHEEREVFAVLFLDNQHRVLAFESLFFGTINAAAVYPRVVAKRVLHHNAAAVILAHNHPSGVAEPSSADIRITERISQALSLLEVRTLDHLVIGDGEPVSLAERGLMQDALVS